MFLTRDQLFELTGYHMKSKQVKWLRDNGIQFYVARDGYPRVVISTLESKPSVKKTVPNYAAIKKAG